MLFELLRLAFSSDKVVLLDACIPVTLEMLQTLVPSKAEIEWHKVIDTFVHQFDRASVPIEVRKVSASCDGCSCWFYLWFDVGCTSTRSRIFFHCFIPTYSSSSSKNSAQLKAFLRLVKGDSDFVGSISILDWRRNLTWLLGLFEGCCGVMLAPVVLTWPNCFSQCCRIGRYYDEILQAIKHVESFEVVIHFVNY